MPRLTLPIVKAIDMSNGLFKLVSGREVNLEEFHVHISALGYLLGTPNLKDALSKLSHNVSQIFGGDRALFVREPSSGPFPTYTFYAFLCSEPLHPEADCSELVVCWFGNSLPESVRSCIALQLETLDWDKYAKDAYF